MAIDIKGVETLNHDRTCKQSSGLPLGSRAYFAPMPTLHCCPGTNPWLLLPLLYTNNFYGRVQTS